MRTYSPKMAPDKPAELPAFLRLEFRSIQKAAQRADPFSELEELHSEPERLRTGLIALADGTDWNPGSGAGVYAYYGGAWNKLG